MENLICIHSKREGHAELVEVCEVGVVEPGLLRQAQDDLLFRMTLICVLFKALGSL